MSEKLSGNEVFMDNSGFTDGINSTDTDIVSMAQQHIMYKIGKCEFNIRHHLLAISDASIFNVHACHEQLMCFLLLFYSHTVRIRLNKTESDARTVFHILESISYSKV